MSLMTLKIPILILRTFRMEILKKINIEVWFLFLITAGYPIISSIAIPFHIEDSRIFSVPYRVLIFSLSLFIIYKNLTLEKFKNIAILSVSLFWIFYFIKNYYSFNNEFYEPIFSDKFFEIYIRIFVIAWIPSIALLVINYQKLDLLKVAKFLFFTLIIMLSLNLLFATIMPHGMSRLYIFSIYYISYGHYGATLSIISLFFLFFKNKELSPYLLIYSVILGFITIFISGARSPFLAILIVIPYLLILKKNFKLIGLFLLLLIITIIGIYYFGKSDDYHNMFVDRTYLWLFEGDNSLRTPLFHRALEIFKENPILGGRTHYEDGMYPHNLFLELLMATGLVGFILYLTRFYPLVKNFQIFSTKITNHYYILFFALFLQYFVLSSTSFTLYSVPEFLYFSSIIIGISLNKLNEETKGNDGRWNPSRNN